VFIVFVLILLAVLMGILSVVYSIFAPFMQNIWNVVYFNSAYYWALAGVERANLVLKYKQPWFEGSGWFLQWETFWPQSDSITWDFGLLSSTDNWFAWTISSRTNKIPSPWKWNVDYLFTSWNDSKDYNKLSYYMWEKIDLSFDDTKNPDLFYTGISIIRYFSWWSFSWIIRLPPAAITRFDGELLCDTCDHDDDWMANDIMVNWILDWFNNWIPFSIVPTISVFYYSWGIVDETKDIAIREKVINETWFLNFWNLHWYSPLVYTNILTEHNVLSFDDSIKNDSFNYILDWSTTGLKLWLWIINMLRTQSDNIYPFLEYQFSFPKPVSDSFYTLQWIGLVWDYNVKIFIKKSTNEQAWSIGDFTIIF
jgi:hypothetical protein